jgi:hypothetical protein
VIFIYLFWNIKSKSASSLFTAPTRPLQKIELFIIEGWSYKHFDIRSEKPRWKVNFVIARDSCCGYLVENYSRLPLC